MFHAKFHIVWFILYPHFLEMAKVLPSMAKTWCPNGSWNWFFLNLNQCAQGCSMQNFTQLDVSSSPLSQKWMNMALLWPQHGPHIFLQIGSTWILINVPSNVPCQISYFWVYPVIPFPRNDQNMALLWPKDGHHMVLKISSFWIIIIVPGDAPCQISQFW